MNKTLWYDTPAKHWTDALPLGNGSLGAMVFFNTSKERIALNCDTLWTGRPQPIKKDGAYESLLKAKQMVEKGELYSAQKELESGFSTCWSQAYLTLGDIVIKYDDRTSPVSRYRRELSLEDATANAVYYKSGKKITSEAFVSKPADMLAYRITSEKNISFTVEMKCPLLSNLSVKDGMIILTGVCPGDSDSYSPHYPCNSLVYSDDKEKNGVSFAAAVRIKTNGTLSPQNKAIRIENSTDTEIYMTVKTNFVDAFTPPCNSNIDPLKLCLDILKVTDSKSYGQLKEEHIEDFSSLFNKTSFSLFNKNKNSDLPTDKRLKAFQKDTGDLELYELLYNFARYLAISSSREGSQAANLQGIWNEHTKAPWNSNYTININTQMNYWPFLSWGLTEEFMPLVELIKALSITGEKTAHDYYRAGGFVAHHNSDIWGFSAPTTGNVQWSFFPGGSGWLCHNLFEYYEYTLDRAFLVNTALPIMKKASRFYLDILTEDEKGRLIISPAVSPENSFKINGKSVSLAKTSTIMNTIVLDLFKNTITAYEQLELNDGLYSEIKNAVKKIQPFKTGSKGQLLEWEEEYEECDIHHRHVSHLIGLHPFSIINESDMPEIFDACRKTLDIRGDDGTGWSLGWKINFYARLNDGNRALKLLKRQLKPIKSRKRSDFNYGDGGGTYPNLFDAHPPFQIDGNFALANGIIEMLARSDGKTVKLLPALPEEWTDGKVTGLRVKGNAVLSFEWHNSKLTGYTIEGNSLEVI